MPNGPQAALIVLAIVIPVVALAIYLVERRHGKARRREEVVRLPLFGTDQLQMRGRGDTVEENEVDDVPPPPPPMQRPTRRSEPVVPQLSAPPGATRGGPAPERPAPHPERATATQAPLEPRTPPATTPPVPSPRPVAPPAAVPDARFIEGETLRFVMPPADGTVEFLPGRLEVVAGPEAGREIRFARAPGEGDVEVTFGRSEGPPNRHIQVLARTVSRRHAVMTLRDEHWELTNLSSTNPLVLNGRVFAGDETAPLLVEGDRIEMGEVAFVFHDG